MVAQAEPDTEHIEAAGSTIMIFNVVLGSQFRFGSRRLSLDKEDIEAAGGRSADDVLLAASLSAKWENGDAIDRAMVEAVGGDKKVTTLPVWPCSVQSWPMLAPAQVLQMDSAQEHRP